MGRKYRLHPSRLADQLLTSFGVLLLLAGSFSLGFNYYLYRADLTHEMQLKAASVTRSLRIAVGTTNALNPEEQIQQMVTKYGTLPGVLEVAVLDGLGNTITQTDPEATKRSFTQTHPQIIPLVEQVRQTTTEVFEATEWQGQPVLLHILPLQLDDSRQKADLRLVIAILDLETMQQESQESFLIATLAMLAITLGALGIMGLVLKKMVLNPLHFLTQQVANGTENGDLVLAQGLPNNEIRWLAETFNQVFQARYQAEQTLHYRALWLQKQGTILSRLAKHRDISEGNFQGAVQAITEATAETLIVDRVSIWLYNEQKTQLNCIDLFVHHLMQPDLSSHTADLSLAVEDYPAYFHAVETAEQVITVDDAFTDPRTHEFIDTYLVPLNVQSMLDVPIRVSGQTVGVLCIERVGQLYFWTPEDQSFARSVGDLVALSIEARDRKLAEQLLRQQTAELQQTLQELKRTQAQMIQSEKMSSLGQLVAGIAHEINNPVNFIYGNSKLAAEDVQSVLQLVQLYEQHCPDPSIAIQEWQAQNDWEFLAADLPKMLSSMRVGAERIREIVQSLRTFARLDEAEYKQADVHTGIESTLMILQHRLKGTKTQPEIQVVKHYGDIPAIDCYPGQLNQVLLNLLTNAIEAVVEQPPVLAREPRQNLERSLIGKLETPPTITISTQQISASHIEIRIADNGPGITESVRARLFDPFFTTKPVGQGTGLGLSISYQIIVQKHGGRLYCLSTPETGTTFVIELFIRNPQIYVPLVPSEFTQPEVLLT